MAWLTYDFECSLWGREELIVESSRHGKPSAPDCCETPMVEYEYRFDRNAQIREKERPAVWYHPVHGYRYPGRNDTPMPDYYKKEGFERKEFYSVKEHEKFDNTKPEPANQKTHNKKLWDIKD